MIEDLADSRAAGTPGPPCRAGPPIRCPPSRPSHERDPGRAALPPRVVGGSVRYRRRGTGRAGVFLDEASFYSSGRTSNEAAFLPARCATACGCRLPIAIAY